MPNGKAVATQPKQSARQLLPTYETRIAQLLGGTGSRERAQQVIAGVLTELAKTPKLQECDPISLVAAVCDAVAVGLIPGSLRGEAYLVPFWDKKSGLTKVQLIPGYRGYVKLAHQSELISKIEARIVYAGEMIQVDYGTDARIVHRPDLAGKRGPMTHAYAVAKLRTGDTQFVVMNMEELTKRRSASKNGGEGSVWDQWYEEMCQKTVVRALAKMLPLGEGFRAAEELDNRADTGVISAPLPHETPDDIAHHVADQTKQRMAELSGKLSPEEAAEEARQAAMDAEDAHD